MTTPLPKIIGSAKSDFHLSGRNKVRRNGVPVKCTFYPQLLGEEPTAFDRVLNTGLNFYLEPLCLSIRWLQGGPFLNGYEACVKIVLGAVAPAGVASLPGAP